MVKIKTVACSYSFLLQIIYIIAYIKQSPHLLLSLKQKYLMQRGLFQRVHGVYGLDNMSGHPINPSVLVSSHLYLSLYLITFLFMELLLSLRIKFLRKNKLIRKNSYKGRKDRNNNF